MISKKKIAKKGKKKVEMRRDASALQEQMAYETKAHNIKEKVKKQQELKKSHNEPLFKVDTTADLATKAKLDKDRFKKKQNILPDRLGKQIQKIAHNINKNQNGDSNQKNGNTEVKKAGPMDLWGTPVPKASELSKNKNRQDSKRQEGLIFVPNVLKPHAGESYNPSQDSHNALLQNIVDIDDKLVNGIQMPSKVKDLSKRDAQQKKAKPRSKKEQKVLEELEIKRKIKENKLMEYNYGKFLKEAKKDVAEHGTFFMLMFRKNA